MKAAIVFTGTGPILVLTTFESLRSPEFIQRLAVRGMSKFIAYEVMLDSVRERYGTRFSVVAADLTKKDDLRVLDIDGHHVFYNFSFEEYGPATYSTPPQKAAPESAVEKGGSDWLWVKIDEYGNLLESSYLPMVGSRIVPPIPMGGGEAARQARFRINSYGVIVDGSPADLNGHKLVLYRGVSPALGRTDTVIPSCTWSLDDKGGWTCI